MTEHIGDAQASLVQQVERFIERAKAWRIEAFFASFVRKEIGLPESQIEAILDAMVKDGRLGIRYEISCGASYDCMGDIITSTLPEEGTELECPRCGEVFEFEKYMAQKRYVIPKEDAHD